MSDIVENCDITGFGFGYEDLAKLELELELDDGTIVFDNENSEINTEPSYVSIEEPEEDPVVEQEEEPVDQQEELVDEPVEEQVDEQAESVEEQSELVEEQAEPVEEPVVEDVLEPVEDVLDPVEELIQEPVIELEDVLPDSQETLNITISMEENEIISVTEPEPDFIQEDPIVIPKIVFIVPYRNRKTQLEAFQAKMKLILEDYPKEDYVIHYIHQMDERVFNRGAMKNIGFLVVKNKYPNHYKNITLVFNDVDTMPLRKNLFNYHTTPGVVKHFFGFTYTLGGIVSIKAADFERVNGFPNFWAWGYEDNLIQKRLETVGITIDRSIFYKLGDKNIIQKNEEITREVNQSEYDRYVRNTPEGIYSIQNLDYNIDNESGFVNVKWFNTEYNPNVNTYRLHDLRQGSMPYDTKFGLMYNNRRIRRGQMRMGI
jgi:hypothetical protein